MARTPRCLVADLAHDDVDLPPEAEKHLRRVLRLGEGQSLELIDGEGGLARAQLLARTGARIVERAPPAAPTEPRVELAVAVPQPARLEWLVGQACELDVRAVHLLQTRFGERQAGPARLARLRRIADEALPQCRRLHRMPVHAPVPLASLLDARPPGPLWLACPPPEGAPPPGVGATGVLLLVGPEGGFDADEQRLARAAGALPVRLGTTVLRVETAAVALAALARL